MLIPVQYSMGHSQIELEDSDFQEPTILWLISHMPSGTRKSKLYKFISKLMLEAYKNKSETLDQSNSHNDSNTSSHSKFNINQATFEVIGQDMAITNNIGMWFFDEGRSFFSQVKMYNNGTSRNEAALLSLYDGGEWNHKTVASTNFEMPFTKLVIGGFTQTSHMLELQGKSNLSQNQSGFIPRFLTFMLKPVSTDIRLTKAEPETIINELVSLLSIVDIYHENAQKSPTLKHIVERGTSAFELFCRFSNTVNDWITDNYNITRLERIRGMVSKSIGQVLRMSAMLNSLFLFHNPIEVIDFENSSSLSPSKNPTFLLEQPQHPLPVSLMAMEAAIQIVTFSLHQNFILQGLEFIELNCKDGLVHIQDSQQSLVPASTLPPPPESIPSSTTSSTTRASCQSDLGKILLLPGMTMNIKRVNEEKKLGRGKEKRLQRVFEVFQSLMRLGFGALCGNVFEFRADIILHVRQDDELQNHIFSSGVQISRFEEARQSESKYKNKREHEVPIKKAKTDSLSSSNASLASSSSFLPTSSSNNAHRRSPIVNTLLNNQLPMSPDTWSALDSSINPSFVTPSGIKAHDALQFDEDLNDFVM